MSDFTTAFPNSSKVHIDGPQQVRVPMREIALSGGEPQLREPWVRQRSAKASDERCVTQLHYARKGDVTPEMEFIAIREGLPADFVCDEVARGRAIIPSNIRHL